MTATWPTGLTARVVMVADVVVVVAFVVIGRSAHRHGEALAGIAGIAWPFLAGLVAGWGVARRSGGIASRRGWAVVTVADVVVGMALRVVAGQGTAVSFTIVALVFLGACFGAVRAVAARQRPA